jgi:hypothetical protein
MDRMGQRGKNGGGMTLQRIDRLNSPPIVGKYYLVPAIWFSWGGRKPHRWWPAIGRKHNDIQFFQFPHQHYHIDVRFANSQHIRDAGRYSTSELGALLSTPISNPVRFPEGPPSPQWRRMRCRRAEVPYPFLQAKAIKNINKHFSGLQCKRAKTGWICPHRNVRLGSIAPVNGVITCPLHGLCIDPVTGIVVGPPSP